MTARRGLRKSRYCLRCARECIVPFRAEHKPVVRCPFCFYRELYWGTWEGFMQTCAQMARSQFYQEVGDMVGKVLSSRRN